MQKALFPLLKFSLCTLGYLCATSDVSLAQLAFFGVDPPTAIIPVDSMQTIDEVCQSNREGSSKSRLTIKGKGGIPAEPGLPLDSDNITIKDNLSSSTSTVHQPIETSQGNIQPARGVQVNESGEVILTAYRNTNSGDKSNGIAIQRLPEIKPNCGV